MPYVLSVLFGGSSNAVFASTDNANVDIHRLVPLATMWNVAKPLDVPAGMRLFADAPRPARLVFSVVRSIVRSNPRMEPFDALVLATHAIAAAKRESISPAFFCSTLLQESAFDPGALSPAGAVGIGQFTLGTASEYGVDPFDWVSSIDGSARLIAQYTRAYTGRYADPYAIALAAYNAGPGTVTAYRGVPPYPETREYIGDIYDRWSRIVRDMTKAPNARRR